MEQLTEIQTNVLPIGTPQNGSMGSQISFSELLGQPFEYLQNSSIDSGRESLTSNSTHSSPTSSECEKSQIVGPEFSQPQMFPSQFTNQLPYTSQCQEYGYNYAMNSNYLMQPMYSYPVAEQSQSPPFVAQTSYQSTITPSSSQNRLPIEYSSPLPSNVPTPGSKISRKSPKKKKKKDPNEPNRPVSAYALFFRETQSLIKSQKPDATFGEISKIVASMWDGLGDTEKTVYKQKTENAKREYLRELAAYRASLVSCGPTQSVLPDFTRGRKPY